MRFYSYIIRGSDVATELEIGLEIVGRPNHAHFEYDRMEIAISIEKLPYGTTEG